MLRREPPRAVGIEAAIEELAGVGRVMRPGVRRSPFEDETAVAIAAFDEAQLRVDPHIDARMAEFGRDFARAVAGDRTV